MQVEWSTIEALGQTRSIDLWYLVPTGTAYTRMRRQKCCAEPGSRCKVFDDSVVEGAPHEITEQAYRDAVDKYRPSLQATWRDYFREHGVSAVISPVVRMPAFA